MLIELENGELQATLNTVGGAIESIRERETRREHIWQYNASLWPRRTAVCFPICSLLSRGNYLHGGISYSLPMHGFLRECDLRAERVEKRRAVLRLSETPQTFAQYPFPFLFELDEQLKESGMEITYRVTNTGEQPLPFSVGAHYTYALPQEQKDCWFRFSREQHAGRLIMENGLVTGKSGDIFHGAKQLSMEGLFDDGAVILEQKDFHTDYVSIGAGEKEWTRVVCKGFPYLVLWAPKGGESPFVCVEPWAGMADNAGNDGTLVHKKGIQTLLPGDTMAFGQFIQVPPYPTA